MFNHIGHFIHESLGRLWISRVLEFRDVDIYMSFEFGLPNSDSFIWTLLSSLGIPHTRIKRLTGNTYFKKILVPNAVFAMGLNINTTRFFSDFISSNYLSCLISSEFLNRNIIVSRAALPDDKGKPIQLNDFDSYMADKYKAIVFYPEQNSIPAQIAAYNSAKSLVFIEGSALYLLLFCKRNFDRTIYIIARRKSSGWFLELMKNIYPCNWVYVDAVVDVPFARGGFNDNSLIDWSLVKSELIRHKFE